MQKFQENAAGEEYSLTVAVLGDHQLNLDDAIGVKMTDLDAEPFEDDPDELIYVPRFPRDKKEADAMLHMITIFTDTMHPENGVRTYAGYSDAELLRGKPGLRVR